MQLSNETCSPPQYIGMQLRMLRAGRRMSQKALARTMTERGHAWHDVTVSRIEAGRQNLRLEEAAVLAEIFETDVASFLPPRRVAS